jgi:hypothetical protein
MARVRYIGPEPVTVPELGGRTVEPDEVVEIPDQRFEAYACQVTTWEAVDEPRAQDEVPTLAPTPLKKSAAKPQREG